MQVVLISVYSFKQVQEHYPFLTIQKRLVYEDKKVDGIVEEMKKVLGEKFEEFKSRLCNVLLTACFRETVIKRKAVSTLQTCTRH